MTAQIAIAQFQTQQSSPCMGLLVGMLVLILGTIRGDSLGIEQETSQNFHQRAGTNLSSAAALVLQEDHLEREDHLEFLKKIR